MNKRSDDFVNTIQDRDITFAREHPYEYVEQIRAQQGRTCSCCSTEATDGLDRLAVALQKEREVWERNRLAFDHHALIHALRYGT